MPCRNQLLEAFALLVTTALANGQTVCPRGALPAYAHNDYTSPNPLTDALRLGYQGVEADVFLVEGKLRTGHDRKAARAGRTLEAVYLRPLKDLAARCHSLTSSGRKFLLTIELKESSQASYDSLASLIARYEESLKSSVEIVLVGWYPASSQLAVQHRLGRNDARNNLDARVRLISIDYGKTIGRWWATRSARRRWLAAIRNANAATPEIPIRAYNVPVDPDVYRTLLEAGVDLIGTKDLVRTGRALRNIHPSQPSNRQNEKSARH